jgi:hypothetical protein
VKENRSQPRLKEMEIIRVTVVPPSKEAEVAGRRTVFSVSKDVSIGGLSFSILTPPEVGARLNLRVIFSSTLRTVTNLVGRVVWAKKAEDGRRYKVGVDLSESPAPALAQWKKAVARRFAEEAAPVEKRQGS